MSGSGETQYEENVFEQEKKLREHGDGNDIGECGGYEVEGQDPNGGLQEESI